MKSVRFLDRRAGYSLASLGLLLGMVVPSVLPAFASAANLTTRSIAISTAAAGATATYELKATLPSGVTSAGGLVIEFCNDSPLIGTSCTHPTGMDVSGVSAGSGTATSTDATDKSTIKWLPGSAVTAGNAVDVVLSGIKNPTAVGTFYARLTTYNAAPNYTNATTLGTVADSGSVALSTTDSVGVTAYVLESMSFCVANVAPTKNCTGISGHAPNLTLGETTGSVIALDSAHLSTGDIYAQLSTNASSGAIVNLKSNATSCGGLFRNGVTTNCDIAAQNVNGNTIAAGQAFFGLKLGTAANASDASASADHTGTLVAATGSHYDTTNYYIDAATNNTTGVTSTYGSKFIDTAGGVVSNMNMPITLGASISNQTPAGAYGASLSLIATGTF
jgi:hypothetical protein